GPMAAVDIAGGQFDGQVGQAEFFIDADLSPHSGVAGVFRGTLFQPGVVAELTDARDGMKDPEALAGSDVEAANVPFNIVRDFRSAAGPVGRANNYGVADDNRSRVQADFAGFEIDILIVVEFEIDDSIL